MQATRSGRNQTRRWPSSPAPPGCRQQPRERTLAIEFIDGSPARAASVDARTDREPLVGHRPTRLRLSFGIARTAILLGLASLAILVVLPAALAAEAALTF